MPILDATGAPFPPAHFGPILKQLELSERDTEVIKDILVWQVNNHFEPTLVCLSCAHNGFPDTHWKMVTSVLPTGQVVVTCGCSQHTGFAPYPNVNPAILKVIEVIGQRKNRPISQAEASLLTAWKHILAAKNWAEGLICQDCFAGQAETGEGVDCSVHGHTIPGKSIVYNCSCTKREWVGVVK